MVDATIRNEVSYVCGYMDDLHYDHILYGAVMEHKDLSKRREQNRKSEKNRRDRNKQIVLEAKKAGCKVCGYNKCPDSIDFHHVNPNTKELKLSDAWRFWSAGKLQKELDKCITICANCHREIHYNERNNINIEQEVKDILEATDKLIATSKPHSNLGLATTQELLEELMARARTGGYNLYRTVDPQ